METWHGDKHDFSSRRSDRLLDARGRRRRGGSPRRRGGSAITHGLGRRRRKTLPKNQSSQPKSTATSTPTRRGLRALRKKGDAPHASPARHPALQIPEEEEEEMRCLS